MHVTTSAIVCATRAHGEHGVVVRLMTPAHGLVAGYVAGGRARATRPVLMAGNLVAATLRARTDTQLPSLAVELTHSRAGLHGEPLAAATIEWSTALAAAALPESQPYPSIHAALDGLLAAIEAAPAARGWAGALVRYELLLLSELGFGLDLTACAAGGDLAFVRRKSGQAVSREAGAPYAHRLLPLPAFLLAGGEAGWDDILAGLALTGFFLERDLLGDRRGGDVLAARARLVQRIGRLARPAG
ncbi:MAG TPA: DNA repair protein RecO C-terminal domain-containing protein [Sphingomonas sp.]